MPALLARNSDLSTDYSPMFPVATRQSDLHTSFHFTCTCARCRNPQSDTRLRRIQDIESTLADWSSTSPATLHRSGPHLAHQLVKLYQDDGLQSTLVRPYGLLAQEYSALRDRKRTMKYAKLAVRYALLKEMDGGGDVRSMRDLTEGQVLEDHWSWGLRDTK